MSTVNESTTQTSTQRILERAIEVINEAGEAAIRTNPIAIECGVTPPILYRAFHSREGLVIAAQTERYRRATKAAVARFVELVHTATSRQDLISKVSESLDFMYADNRRGPRGVRASVIGSAVSRPELRAAIAQVDAEYMQEISDAYGVARKNGWIDPSADLPAIALWAQGITNSRILVEFANDTHISEQWNMLSKRAILDAIFGNA